MAGIDFGNLTCYMAVARNKGIEIVENDYSLHATPSCVSFGQFARMMGFGAKQQLNVNYGNSVVNFKHILGRTFNDKVVQTFRQHIPCGLMGKFNDDQIEIKVTHLGTTRVLSPEQVVACLLTHLRVQLSRSLGTDVTECVINVPFFYEENQRRALLNAGRIAGLSLRLITDPAALAYCYGMYNGANLPPPEQPARLVAFVDVGHSSVQASLIAFSAGKAEVLAASFDLTVGGVHFDALLRDYFNEDFGKRFKIDARKTPRAWLRLLDECEKIKKQMSANSQPIPFAIECFVKDTDVNGVMQRDQFERLAEKLFQKVHALLQQLISDANVKVGDIFDVELVGGSSRIPRIKQIVAEFFKKEPKTTMNQDDALARGCALRSAMLYPAYQVKKFTVIDRYEMPIDPSALSDEEKLKEEIKAEQEMQTADLRDKQRSDAKNALEEYCFKTQHTMEDEQLAKGKVSDEERHKCIEKCNSVLEWLDNESETLQRKQIECRHNELEEFCRPILAKLYAVVEHTNKNGETDKMDSSASPQQPPTPAEDKKRTTEQKNAGGGAN
ncbi:hypothetical protein niasHS_015055 [Heterodera schachtii]|uniref:Uncharacterized protein n=1 Tax=Heterodera schachtii TaxID=97005 RepID=A0ABD2I8Q0_HETSC